MKLKRKTPSGLLPSPYKTKYTRYPIHFYISLKMPFLQTLIRQPETSSIPIKAFQFISVSVIEVEQRVFEWIQAETILDDMCVSIDAFTQIGDPADQIDGRGIIKPDHDAMQDLMIRARESRSRAGSTWMGIPLTTKEIMGSCSAWTDRIATGSFCS